MLTVVHAVTAGLLTAILISLVMYAIRGWTPERKKANKWRIGAIMGLIVVLSVCLARPLGDLLWRYMH